MTVSAAPVPAAVARCVLALPLLLGACSVADTALMPSLTGEPPVAAAAQPAPPVGAVVATPIGNQQFQPLAIAPGASTGTVVGQKVQQTRTELQTLQSQIAQRNARLQQGRAGLVGDSQRYYGTVAAITQRLQIGTTPGNPILTSQWNQAQQDLERLAAQVGQTTQLGNDVAADSAMAAYILESIRATYRMSGAIDEDHRQLAVLEDETNRTVVLIDRILNEVTQEVSRQTVWLGAERANLNTLALGVKNGELLGPSLANRAYSGPAAAAPGAAMPERVQSFVSDGRQPLVVIRFDRNDVPFQQPLYNAVSTALERRPQATFELVAVAAQRGNAGQGALNQNQARRHADRVLRSLSEMGLPPSRITMSTANSATAQTNEVHLYIR